MESGGGKGQVESLWGRIRVSEMGSRVARERPAIGALPSSAVGGGGGGAVRGKRSLLEAAGALSGTSYRPRTKETNAAWEYLLAFVAARLGGGEEREVLGAAAEECLAVLKREDMRDLDKKELLEKTLGIGMDADAYAQLVNLTKRITDFVVAAQGASRVSVAAGQEDDEKGGVAVVFEEDEDEEAAADLVAGEDDEEVEAEMESMIPTIRFEDAQPAATTTVALSEDEDYGGAAVAGISSKMDVDDAEAHLDAVDLELLAFPNGGHTMTNKKCIVPEKSVKISKPGYEEIHIPAPTPRPMETGERLVEIASLPEWTRPAFAGVTDSLNRVQSRLHRTALETDDNFLLCAPTGAGKTNVALLAMLREIGKHCLVDGEGAVRVEDKDAFKMVYIAPMKALVQEMVQSFSRRLEPYGLRVAELSGDQTLSRAQIDETQVIVTTPEKWDIITRKNNNDTSYTRLVRLVVIDEIHLLHDDRGPVLEAIVARTLRQCEATQSWTRLVGLSATLPNYMDVGRFLRVPDRRNVFYFDASYRPCPLAQQFVGVTERRPLQRMQLLNEITFDKISERIGKSQLLVFVHSRKDTAKTARAIRDLAISKGSIAHLLKVVASSKERLAQAAEGTRNADLSDLLPYGFAIHHAGMTRTDRGVVEELFAAGHVQVLFCTATLAWGVNLPAHTVIIKGTQVYSPEKGRWCELSAQDVLQMLGRAGRPQYDTQGEGIIVTTQDQVQFYLSLLNQQLPIESQLLSRLVDHLNAEIVLGTVTNRREAVEWLGYSYLFVRMRREPLLYGLSPEEVAADPALRRQRGRLIHSAALRLEERQLVRYDHRMGLFRSTEQGRIASHYYLGHESMGTFNQLLKASATEMDLCRIFAASHEFRLIPVRQEERLELQKLAERVPLPIRENYDEPTAKINILLQAHISRLGLEGFSLAADMVYVTQSAGRILRALFELCLRRGWARAARRALELCKMVEHRQWRSMTPLRQAGGFGVSPDIIRRVERKDFPWDPLFDLDAHELGELVRMPAAGKVLHAALQAFPRVKVETQTVPLTRDLMRIDLTVTPANRAERKQKEVYWVMIEDVDGEGLLFADSLVVQGTTPALLTAYVPIQDPLPPAYFVTVTADRWLGSETRVPVILGRMTLPEKRSPPTELSPPPTEGEAPRGGLREATREFAAYPEVVAAYGGETGGPFNEIVSATLPALFRSDHSVFIGCSAAAVPGSLTAITCAELAIWRALIQDAHARCVYLVPQREMMGRVRERLDRTFASYAGRVVELTGDSATDLKSLERGVIILSDAASWDQLSRRWKSRRNVQSIALCIVDGVHYLSAEPAIEVVLSRMRSMAAQLERTVRLLVMGVSGWNPREAGAWLGIPAETTFNYDPILGSGATKIALQAVAGVGLASVLTRPAWRLARDHGGAFMWVSDARQARTLALDLVALQQSASTGSVEEELARSESRAEEEEEAMPLAAIPEDDLLDECVKEGGVAYLDGSHPPSVVQRVLRMFEENRIKMVVLAKDGMLHRLPHALPTVPINVIVGSQEYRSGGGWTDYPMSSLLGMIHSIPARHGALVLCPSARRTALATLLAGPLPLESSLDTVLADTLNAEIAVRTIVSKQDAVDYLTWTYLYRRLARNPNYYGLAVVGARALSEHLSELVEGALGELAEAKCIQMQETAASTKAEASADEQSSDEDLLPLNLGLIAAYYGVKCATVEMLALSLTATSKIRGILECVAAAAEFDEVLPVRWGEASVLERLQERLPIKIPEAEYGDPHVKTLLLLQAHFSRLPLPRTMQQDQRLVVLRSLPLVQAVVDVLASYGFLAPALLAMEFSQMLVQARWNTDPPLSQLFDGRLLSQLTQRALSSVYDLDDEVLRDLQLDDATQRRVKQFCDAYPAMDVQFGLDNDELVAASDSLVRVSVVRQSPLGGVAIPAPHFPGPKEEAWWLLLGSPSTRTLLGLKRFILSSTAVQADGTTSVVVNVPFTVPDGSGQCSAKLYLVSDCWMGVDQEFDLSFTIVPARE